jgi:hypothetical protein
MQSAVRALIDLGPLPNSAMATVPLLKLFEERLRQVRTPVSNEEANELVKLFGPDDCFGLAWTLLHLIETAPGWPIEDAISGLEGEWIERLRERAV